ncbi:phage tail assembly protein [Novosphingobium sp. SL115]|uniref:phage tail assembly protein n=1 Tax=Novosphingobium sp. SL115 TaxID=2995150 RepID=UPI0022757DBB|nr:phage tail assembly protein [Novosphingobium sp. SL115]MCY1672129.1 phage tail assembly protein [Novosphingobium sp. SL115]
MAAVAVLSNLPPATVASAHQPRARRKPRIMSDQTTPQAVTGRTFETVALSAPITRGETTMDTLNIRRPKAGELRGLSLQDVMNTDIVAMLTLIPRISEPPLTPDEVNNLDPADFSEIAGTVRGFFMTKAEKGMIEAVMSQYQPKT